MDNLTQGVGQSRDSKTAQNRFTAIEEDTALGVNDNVVHIDAVGVTATLPQVADAAGRLFAIKVTVDVSGTDEEATIQDNDESYGWSDLTCSNASGGSALLYSDGEQWFILASTNIS